MNDLFVTMLTSSVIASLIAVVSNIFLNQKKNSIEYITNERKLWRKEIREIAEEIEKSDRDNTHLVLTKLKVRINAYDYFIKNKQERGDYVIWKLMNMYDKEIGDDILNIIKKYLILSLSLMLKYDWERSKEEINIDKNNLIMYMCCVMQVMVYLSLVLFLNSAIITSILLTVNYIYSTLLMKIFMEQVNYNDNAKKRTNKIRIPIIFLIYIIVFTIYSIFNLNVVINGIVVNGFITKIVIGISMTMPTHVQCLIEMKKNSLSKKRYEYICALHNMIDDMNKEFEKFLKN